MFNFPTFPKRKFIFRTSHVFHSTDSSVWILAHASVIESRVLFTRTVRTSLPRQTKEMFPKKNVLITYLSLQQSKHITITIFLRLRHKSTTIQRETEWQNIFQHFSSWMLDFLLVYTKLFILHVSFLQKHVNLLPAIIHFKIGFFRLISCSFSPLHKNKKLSSPLKPKNAWMKIITSVLILKGFLYCVYFEGIAQYNHWGRQTIKL